MESRENGKYLAIILDDSALMCDEVIESYKEDTKTLIKNITCRTQNFNILLAFLLSSIALLIAVKTSRKTKTFITISQHKE